MTTHDLNCPTCVATKQPGDGALCRSCQVNTRRRVLSRWH